MKQLLTILKKDLRSYFDQPTGYILNIIFIVAIAFMFFRTIDTTNEASLRPMFSLLPWILAIYIPAVSMRLFSEEQRDGTLEILFTQPVRGTTVILAKFMAGLIFITIGILGTILIPISLIFAGDLDIGALIAQYIGAILLSSSLVSIGIFASSLTKNQIVAFIISLSVSMILLVLGLDFINITLPSSLSILLQDLSPLTHFSSITRGLIDLRDVLYFISIDIAFLSITYLNTKGKSLNSDSPQYRNLRIGVGSLVVLSLVFAWFGSSIQGRIDLTEDKIYSLAPSTKQIFNDLDDYLTITLYESKDHPINTALTARDVNDFLSDLDARSKYIKIKHRYPDADEKDREESEIAGIPPVQFNVQRQGEFQVKTGYLGMTLAYANNKEVIPFIESLDGLEYKLASLTFKMLNDKKKSITFIDLPYSKTNQSMGSFISLLAQQYDISVINMNDIANIANPPDVFIIAGGNYENVDMDLLLPKNKIHDLILKGVSFFVLVDTVNIDNNRMVAYPNEYSGSMLWENFGIIIKNNMLYDLVSYETLPFGTQSGEVLLPYPYWIRTPPNDSKVTGKVNSTLFPWASSIELIEPLINNIKTDPIIISAPTTSIQYDYQDLSPDAKFNPNNNTGSQILGVKIENKETDSDVIIRSIIVSDSDWLTDNIAGRNQSNYALGMNMIDWLAQENQLADIRSKVIRERKLDWSSKGSFFSHQSLTKNLNLILSPIILIIYGLIRYTNRKTIQRKVFKNEE
ncbi:MAG: Gldg family protein [Dehalococcoidia bacterium]